MRSAFANSHPALNFLFFGSVVAFGMVFFHPVFLGVSFVAALLYSVRLRGRGALKWMRFLLPTLLIVVFLGAAFNHYGVTTLFVLSNGNRVTLESIVHAFATGGMVLTVFLWFTCYDAVVTTDKFLHVFGRVFPTGALLVSMTLRFIPLLTRRMRRIFDGQKGIGYSGGKLRGGHSRDVVAGKRRGRVRLDEKPRLRSARPHELHALSLDAARSSFVRPCAGAGRADNRRRCRRSDARDV